MMTDLQLLRLLERWNRLMTEYQQHALNVSQALRQSMWEEISVTYKAIADELITRKENPKRPFTAMERLKSKLTAPPVPA